jgi:phage/plasmid-associated DNA primase
MRAAIPDDERAADFIEGLGIDVSRLPGASKVPPEIRFADALDRFVRDPDAPGGWRPIDPGPAIVLGLVDEETKSEDGRQMVVGLFTWHLEGPQDERIWAGRDGGATLRLGRGAKQGVLVVTHGPLDALAIASATGYTTWGTTCVRSALRVPMPPATKIRRVVFALDVPPSEEGTVRMLLQDLAEKHPHYPIFLRRPPKREGNLVIPWAALLAEGAAAVTEALAGEGPVFEGSESSKGTTDVNLADLEETEDNGLAFVKELCDKQEVDIHRVLSSNNLRRARRFLRECFTPEETGPWRGYAVRRSEETWWWYRGNKYVPIRGESAEPMEVRARQWLNRGWYTIKTGSKVRLARLNPSEKHVNEVLENLKTDVLIDASQMPCWIGQEFDLDGRVIEGERDPLSRTVEEAAIDEARLPHPWELTSYRNGLLDLREWCAGRLKLWPHTERYFGATALPYDFPIEQLQKLADDDGKVADDDLEEMIERLCPTWLEFLKSVNVNEDPDWERLLAMFMGYCLTPWTKYEVILLMAGASGGGKGTVSTWMKALVGEGNFASAQPSIAVRPFTLYSYIGKLWLEFPDAEVGKHTDAAQFGELLKMLSGQDHVFADRKHKDALAAVRLTLKISITCNRVPAIPDPGGALALRFRVLDFVESFRDDGKRKLKFKDPEVIRREAPGLMLWALRGLRQLEEAGGVFPQPRHGAQFLSEYMDHSNPTGSFVREMLVRDDKSWLPTSAKDGQKVLWKREADDDSELSYVPTLYGVWAAWCDDRKREPGGVELFCKHLRACCPYINKQQQMVRIETASSPGTTKARAGGYWGLRVRTSADEDAPQGAIDAEQDAWEHGGLPA